MSSPESRWRLRWRTYRSWSRARRRLAPEAVLQLGASRLLVRFVPFRLTARGLGWHMAETVTALEPRALVTAGDVGWIVERMADHTPWESVCLPRAMAAQRMLRRRGIPSTLYLGLKPDAEQGLDPSAHAWLRCGDMILTGADEVRDHHPVACYATDPLAALRDPVWWNWLSRLFPKTPPPPRPYLAPE